MSFYDFDDRRSENEIEPKHNVDDLLDSDTTPVICDNCIDGRVLIPYQKDRLICPNCMEVYNPIFEHVKHETLELTLDELADTNTGQMGFVDEKGAKPAVTKIRKKLEVDQMPDYVKREIEHIQNRAGYYRHVKDKKLSSMTRNK
jgi:hypothetical protein